MEHLKNPVPIKIEMDIFTSEIEDMDFFNTLINLYLYFY